MPIKVDCPSCGHHYQVNDNLAGKKVKCKTCQAVITIPSADEEFDFSAIEVEPESERAATSSGAKVTPPSYNPPDEDEPAPGDEPVPEYNFKGSNVLESLIPAVLGVGGLGWMAIQAFRADDPAHGWVGPFRAAVYLFVYTVLVFPITLVGIRAVGRKAYVAMPGHYGWKSFGIFSMPAALGAIFTLISPSVAMLLIGVVLGMAISLGAFIFLFGIRPQMMGTAIGLVSGYLIGGTILGIALLFGVNFLTMAFLGLAKTAHEYSISPVGPQFSWNAPPPPQEKPKNKSVVENDSAATQPDATTTPTTAPATEPTTGPSVVDATTKPATTQEATAVNPSTTKAATKPVEVTPAFSPLLAAAPTALPVENFQNAIFCDQMGNSAVLLMTAHTDFGDTFELWRETNGTWSKSLAFSAQPKSSDHGGMVLNAKGTMLARMIDFPRTSVEVRFLTADSASDNSKAKKVDPDMTHGASWEILGFTTAGHVVLLSRGSEAVVDVVDPMALPGGLGSQRTGRAIPMSGFPSNAKCNLVLSPDSRYLASVRYNSVLSASAPVLGNYLTINSLLGTRDYLKLTLSNLQADKPVALNGLCYWPDGSRVSLLFQEGGNGLIETYQSPTGKQLVSHIFSSPAGHPAEDFRGSSLAIIGDGAAFLINGRYVMNADTFEDMGDLGIEGVKDVHVVDRETIELLVKSAVGKTQVLVAKLDGSKFKSTGALKPAAARAH